MPSPSPLPFTAPWLLAPMDGITDPAFRDLVLARHQPGSLGGAFTEFVRITAAPMTPRRLRSHLGPRRFAIPVGLQLMGNAVEAMAETARRAAAEGAPVVDLNFGCPAKGALRTCAGSALLDDPPRIAGLIRACVAAVPGIPVTAKIRAGVEDDSRLEEVACAVEDGGASLLTIHCRTRRESYDDGAIDWSRIRRAVAAVTIPVCGNGGVRSHEDLERMRAETGCRFVMVGRGALADPWLFSGRRVSRAEAADFLLDYLDVMLAATSGDPKHAAARLKQLLRFWEAGDVVGGDRPSWLREPSPQRLFARLAEARSASAEPLTT